MLPLHRCRGGRSGWSRPLRCSRSFGGCRRAAPPGRGCVRGGAFAAGTYWLYTCLHVFGLVPVWLTMLLQAALVGIMAAYSAALCFVANRFWMKPGITRDWLVLPALWVLLEWLRGLGILGFSVAVAGLRVH